MMIEKSDLLKQASLFNSTEEVGKIRLELEASTSEEFQQIEKNRSLAIDESRRKYVD